MAEYQKSMDFVNRLTNRYNGGWAAAMRCVKHTVPDLDKSQVVEAHGRRDFELPVEGKVLTLGSLRLILRMPTHAASSRENRTRMVTITPLLLLQNGMIRWLSLKNLRTRSLKTRTLLSSRLLM